MIQRIFRGRDFGGLIAFLVVLGILLYVSNGLLTAVSNVRIPLIGSRSTQRTPLIDTLAETTPTAVARAASAGLDQATPAASTATATATPEIRQVGNTGGVGVYVRRTPNLNDRIRAWTDNSEMTLLGEETDAGGQHWIKVRDPAGNEGWLPSQYLVGP